MHNNRNEGDKEEEEEEEEEEVEEEVVVLVVLMIGDQPRLQHIVPSKQASFSISFRFCD